MTPRKPAISIWFFIGALLTVYGALILGEGMHDYAHTAGIQMHAGVWWGVLLLVVGLGYAILFRPGRHTRTH